MAVKAIRDCYALLPADSFTAWLASSRSELEACFEESRQGSEEDACWAIRRPSYTTEDQWFDEDNAWFDRWLEHDAVDRFLNEDVADELAVYAGVRDDSDWMPLKWRQEFELAERIIDTFGDSRITKPHSKKHRVQDRSARNERRDGSTRGHIRYGVSRHDVQLMLRRERARAKGTLRQILAGSDADAVYLTAQPTAFDAVCMAS